MKNRRKKRHSVLLFTILSILYLLIFIVNPKLVSATFSDSDFYYYSNRHKNQLPLFEEMLAVRFKQGVSLEQQKAIVESEKNLFKDIELIGATNKDVYLTDTSTNNTFLNMSYLLAKEYVASGSELFRKWYLDVYVNYTNGTSVDSANVSVYNRTLDLLDSDFTDSGGMTKRFEIAEYINSGGTRNYQTNLTINATKDLLYAEKQLNLTKNYLDKEFWLTIV